MSNIIGIETSANICSVALRYKDELTWIHEVVERQQASLLLPMIERLLTQSALKLTQLDAIAFSAGPGSFTGVRLAASVAQGLAYGSALPVIPISSLHVFAQSAAVALKAKNILAATNAYANEIYCGVYQLNDSGYMLAQREDQRCRADEVDVNANLSEEKWVGIGNAWLIYATALRQRVPNLTQINPFFQPHAKDLVCLAQKNFETGDFLPPELAIPNYLYDAEQWKRQS